MNECFEGRKWRKQQNGRPGNKIDEIACKTGEEEAAGMSVQVCESSEKRKK